MTTSSRLHVGPRLVAQPPASEDRRRLDYLVAERLLAASAVTPAQIRRAEDLVCRQAGTVAEALVAAEIVPEPVVAAAVAEVYGLRLLAVDPSALDPTLSESIPLAFARSRRVLPLDRTGAELLLGVVDPSDAAVLPEVGRACGLSVRRVLITSTMFAAGFEAVYRRHHIDYSTRELLDRFPEETAARVLSTGQRHALIGGSLSSIAVATVWPTSVLTWVIGALCSAYVVISLYKLYLVFQALREPSAVRVEREEIEALDERDLPVYTILVPLYREVAVLPGLAEALRRLDYPRAKLDVKLLLEEDDQETIEAARGLDLPAHVQLVVVPDGRPKGKPKACNYGLSLARGEFTTIYDAEDLPESDQLKKVILAFRRGTSDLACVQCKLNYYNQDQNLLTRLFTTEYLTWFNLVLPGLMRARSPIPLGGTSNHFPTAVLRAVGGWDPYNVTEDADLGVRLFKRGYTTAIVDSTTWEEANSDLSNWVRQRSRWIKGYVQTWLVHMRSPVATFRRLGFRAFVGFHVTVGGTFLVLLLNPVFWVLTVVWYLFQPDFVEVLFPTPVFFVASLSLFLGNVAFVLSAMLGCLHHGAFSLVKYSLLLPAYWAAMSVAAWKGTLQLIDKPWYWEKTVHGLHRPRLPLPTEAGLPGVGAPSPHDVLSPRRAEPSLRKARPEPRISAAFGRRIKAR